MLLKGKKGIVFGVANKRSIAWGIGKALLEQGAEVMFSYQNERLKENLEELLQPYSGVKTCECDVSNESGITQVVANVEKSMGKIDFLVHSLAYANKDDLESKFYVTNKDNFLKSVEISAYSLVALSRAFLPILNEGASIIALTYLGSVSTVINYNVMGVSKAALEACVRYLAVDLGERGIRVNAISAGPIQTLAARGIRDFSLLHKIHPKLAPLRKSTTLEDVGGAGVFLVSSLSSGITSEVLYVDGGFHNVAVGPTDCYDV